MNILITGAKGFVGKNLAASLNNIAKGLDKTHPELAIGEIYEYDIDTPHELLAEYCAKADFVYNLAGVNRPEKQEEFMEGNCGFADELLETLKKCGNTCPVMLSSSIQASLEGRYDSEYGRSKKAAEELFASYGRETGARVLIYRFPNLFGKWCRPNYNSVVATFCYNVARDLPIKINDPDAELDLLYIDDLVHEMLLALSGLEHRDGAYCYVPGAHHTTVGMIADLLHKFAEQPQTLMMPLQAPDGLTSKLYSTYLSYLPAEKVAYKLKTSSDARGTFTELIKTLGCGQFSVNITKPGVTKGQHWHHSKWELFIVVAGRGLIRERRLGTDEVLTFTVSGDDITAVHMLPGYTHSITNLSDTEDLVTIMWANECFDPALPDTYREEV